MLTYSSLKVFNINITDSQLEKKGNMGTETKKVSNLIFTVTIIVIAEVQRRI